MRCAILGGSFDPIHIGHLAIAEEARAALGLDQVLFMPAAQQPLKPGLHKAQPAQRLEMTRLALADNPAFQLSDLELQRRGPSYTVESLQQLRRLFGSAAQLFFILGADALGSFVHWRQPEEILKLAQLAVFERPGHSLDLAALERALPALRGRVLRLEGPRLELSSSELRERVRQGRPIRYLVPDPVVAYIEHAHLYRDAASS